jgi:hypothetical protein
MECASLGPRSGSRRIAGILLALVAYRLFLRGHSRTHVPVLEHRLAPVLAFGVAGMVGVGVACLWIAYKLSVWV